MDKQLLWGLAMLAIAASLIAGGYLLRRRARRQNEWLQVPATIMESRAEMGSGWFPNIQFEYVHEGRRIRGLEVYTLQVSRLFKDSLNDVIGKFPIGRSVTAYVNPDDPDQVVLVPGGDPQHLGFMYLMAIVPALAGLRLVVSYLHA